MNKQHALDTIAKEIESCAECKIDTIGQAVPGEGNPDAQVMFVGEAPGKQEAATGRPFIGRSGQLLRSAIRSIGLDDEKDVFITSAAKYLPKRGTPDKKDIEHGRVHLYKQIAVIQPKVIVLLGSVACQSVLEHPVSVAKEHGTILKEQKQTYFISYHPAAAIRFQKLRSVFLNDFLQLSQVLKTKSI